MDEHEIAVKEGDEIPVVLTLAAVDPLPPHVVRLVTASFPALGPLPWGTPLPAAHPMTVAFVGRNVFVPGDCVVVGTVGGRAARVQRAMAHVERAWVWTHHDALDALPAMIAIVRTNMAKLAAGG